jgi:hypothetical protein
LSLHEVDALTAGCGHKWLNTLIDRSVVCTPVLAKVVSIFSSIIMPSCLLCSPSTEDCSTTWGFGYYDQQYYWILCIDPGANLCFQEGIQVNFYNMWLSCVI